MAYDTRLLTPFISDTLLLATYDIFFNCISTSDKS